MQGEREREREREREGEREGERERATNVRKVYAKVPMGLATVRARQRMGP